MRAWTQTALVVTRARHTYIVCTQYIHTHTIVWALTMLENGTSDTCRLIAWSIDVKHYIAGGPFVTASQTTQNNKPKLTKHALYRVLLCRLHVLFPINEAVRSSLHSNYSFFAEIITYYSTGWYIIFICKIFVLFFVLNVKNDRLDATLIIIILAEYTGVIFTLTSGNVTWFYDRNFDFIVKILWR